MKEPTDAKKVLRTGLDGQGGKESTKGELGENAVYSREDASEEPDGCAGWGTGQRGSPLEKGVARGEKGTLRKNLQKIHGGGFQRAKDGRGGFPQPSSLAGQTGVLEKSRRGKTKRTPPKNEARRRGGAATRVGQVRDTSQFSHQLVRDARRIGMLWSIERCWEAVKARMHQRN